MTVNANDSQQQTVGTINSITINGQTLNYGVNGTITLPDMTTIDVTWQSSGGGGGGGSSVTITLTMGTGA